MRVERRRPLTWRHWPRPRLRLRAAAAVVAAVALLGACSGSGSGGGSATETTGSQAQATTTTQAALKPLVQPGTRCGPPDTKATLVRFKAGDGTSLDGVMVGSGTAGVVLVHEYPADLCGFWPFAAYLSHKGMRAFAIDLRCFGLSACPDGDARLRVLDDVAAAVAELHRRGVTRVALAGASMGAAAVLIAGTTLRPPVAAVAELSGEADPTGLIGGIPLNAGAVVKRLGIPAMFVVATDDPVAPVEETRAMYQAAKTTDKQLLVLSGTNRGLHGWDLLTSDATGEHFTPVAAKVAAFLSAHLRG